MEEDKPIKGQPKSFLKRLKENVVDLTLGLDEVNALRPVTFDWKASDIDDIPNNRYGFIAQEVQNVLPELVFGDDPKSVAYQNVVAILVEAIKELKSEIVELQNKIDNT